MLRTRCGRPQPCGELFGRAQQARAEQAECAEQADVEPDPAGGRDEVRVRDGDQPDEDEDHGERSERDQDEPVRHRRRQHDPGRPGCLEDQRGEPDEEDELAEGSGVPAGHRQRLSVRERARVPVGERGDREHEPGHPREPHSPAAGDRGRALRPWPALGSRPERTGWLRRLHRRSMGTKAHRRARGRAFSEDEEAVQDVEVQLEGSAKGSPAPVEVTLDDTGPTAEGGVFPAHRRLCRRCLQGSSSSR